MKSEVQTRGQTLIYSGDTSQGRVNPTDTCSRAVHPTNAQIYLLQVDGPVLSQQKIKLLTLKRAMNRSELKVAQLCSTLCNPVDYTVHGILQARILQ